MKTNGKIIEIAQLACIGVIAIMILNATTDVFDYQDPRIQVLETRVSALEDQQLPPPCTLETVTCNYGSETTESIEEKIEEAARQGGVDPDVAIRIAQCESGLDPDARNPKSTAGGIYQFTAGTWEWIGASGDRFDPNDAIREFIKWYPVYPSWWVCQ